MLFAVPRSDQGHQKIALKLQNGQMNAEIAALDVLNDDTDSLQRDITDSGPASKLTHIAVRNPAIKMETFMQRVFTRAKLFGKCVYCVHASFIRHQFK